jgi:two-component system NtrC family response regulator
LDEIGDLSPKAQAKLLRVLETKQFSRLGGNQVITSNFRLISASNKDLKAMVEEGSFREDLYHRIAGVVIEVPPLRERKEDIPLLVEFFLKKYHCRKHFTEDSLRLLKSHRWKGNVRELKNFVERLCILHDGEEVSKADVERFLGITYREDLRELFEEKDLRTAKQKFEKLFIQKKLREYNGDVKKVAEVIGIDLSNLYRKLKLYGIEV